MVRAVVSPGELLALALAAGSLAGSWRLLEHVRRRSDPRRATLQRIRREASARDLVVFTDEGSDLVAEASPAAAVWGTFPLIDLRGFRRLYVLAPAPAALSPFVARFGPANAVAPGAAGWELAHVARVVLDLGAELASRASIHRDGGVDDGPCPLEGNAFVCHGAPWNHVRVEAHHFDGAEVPCIFAHPQADGRLVIDLPELPPARAVAGAVGLDDGGYFPEGAPVTLELRWLSAEQGPVEHTVVAPNRRGLTGYRFAVPPVPARASLAITTPNAGARQFCFTLYLTE